MSEMKFYDKEKIKKKINKIIDDGWENATELKIDISLEIGCVPSIKVYSNKYLRDCEIKTKKKGGK